MSSSANNTTDKSTTSAASCVKGDDDSTEDTAAKQQTLRIENLSIENKEGDTAMASTNNVDNTTADNITTCSACGKEGNIDNMNICNKCKMVHYCNVACKKKHKSKHKKKCERRIAQLHDEALFKQPPAREDCPICMLPLPLNARESCFKSCCGKYICYGCAFAMTIEEIRKGKKEEEMGMCPYCRMPEARSDEEQIKQYKKLMKNDNAIAFYVHSGHYHQGTKGMPRDDVKSHELLLKAVELGCIGAYFNLGLSYSNGRGVEKDRKKGLHYWELAAIGGNVDARCMLGNLEYVDGISGNSDGYQRAMKHYMIAARAGHPSSLNSVKRGFMEGKVAKDEYESTLRAYHKSNTEINSEARDEAAKIIAAGLRTS